jgi:hypothetical protein
MFFLKTYLNEFIAEIIAISLFRKLETGTDSVIALMYNFILCYHAIIHDEQLPKK